MKILGLPVPPGETIKEQLDIWNISQKEFSIRMDYSEKHIIDIISGRSEINAEFATRLENVLGISADFWLKLQQRYTLSKLKEKKEKEICQEEKILKNIPYADMAKKGWIKSSRKVNEKINFLRRYFGVANLKKIKLTEAVAFRKSEKNISTSYSLASWLRRGENLTKDEDVYPEFSKSKIKKNIIPRIKRELLSCSDINLIETKLKGLCKNAGIFFYIIPHIKNASVNGAVYWKGKNPVIQISLKGKYSDIFWFSFFHELGHVYYSHSKKEGILEDGCNNNNNEIEADKFAKKYLYPQNYYEFCKNTKFTKNDILQYAKKEMIHSGLIAGRLMHDKLIKWNSFENLRIKFINSQ